MISELLLLIGLSFSLGFTPGPNNAVASYSGFNFGIKKTVPLIMGVGLGYTALIVLKPIKSVKIFTELLNNCAEIFSVLINMIYYILNI